MARWVAALVLCGTACGPADDATPVAMADPCTPVALVAAADATDAERGSLPDAAALWKAVAPVKLGVTAGVVADVAAGASAVTGATTIPVRFQSAPLAFLGAYEPDRHDVVVNRDIPDEPSRAIVLAHELGHAFGLGHIEGRPSVMNAANSTIAPNTLDAAALAAIWGPCSP